MSGDSDDKIEEDCRIFVVEYLEKGEFFMEKKVIRARAPVRIDFSGGWTDVVLFTEESKGFVVNAAIDIYPVR